MSINSLLDSFIDFVVKNTASDLHLSTGNKPIARIDGELCQIPNTQNLDSKSMLEMLDSIMSEKQRETYREKMELDFSIKSKLGDRLRINAFMTVNGPSAVLRIIPSKLITLLDVAAPPIVSELCKHHQGLILVVGPTGSGKSSTLAAIINHINNNYKRHIITVEDPVEFIYQSDLSLINQREIGSSTSCFPSALRSALREDPDVIMIGEMRDLETIQLALTAAETGHLVMATLHTNSAAQSINRIIDVFPSNDKEMVRSMISASLLAIISQSLVKKKGGGRVAVYEVLIANDSVRNLIKKDQIPQINSMIEISKKQGMITIKDSLLDLLNAGIINESVAQERLASL